MFVLTELEDSIEIRASSVEKELDVLRRLHQKYVNKLVDGLGLCLYVHEILGILEYEIQSEILVATVRFSAMFQRFYLDETCIGRILKQEEERILIGDGLFSGYEVQAHDLFDSCEFESDANSGRWVWNYKGNHLIFGSGDTVMFRIKGMRFEDSVVGAAMNEQGLGPVKWWE